MAKITFYKGSHTKLAARTLISHRCKLAGNLGAWPLGRPHAASIPAVGQAAALCSFPGWSLQLITAVEWRQPSSLGLFSLWSGTFRALQVSTPQTSWGEEGASQHVWPQAYRPCRIGQLSAPYQAAPAAASNSQNILAICKSCLKCQTIHR